MAEADHGRRHGPIDFAFTLAGGSAADGFNLIIVLPAVCLEGGASVPGPIPGNSLSIHIFQVVDLWVFRVTCSVILDHLPYFPVSLVTE
jgi:hypothetical protein